MKRKYVVLAIGLLVTALSLYLALRGTDFNELGKSLRSARFELVPPIIICLVCFYVLKAFRWRRLLHINGESPSTRQLVGPMMIGFAANNVLPFRLGEIIRIVIGAKRTRLPHVTILTSIVIERAFDVIALLFLATASSWAVSGQGMTHPVMPYISMIALLTTIGLLALAFGSAYFFRLLHKLDTRNRPRLLRLLFDKAKKVEAGLQSARNPAQLVAILINSIMQWLLLALAIKIACWAVGVMILTSTAIYLTLLITIAISIPSSPGFVGVIEYCFVVALGAFGVDAEHALAAAIFYHVINWLSVTFVGTVYLQRYSLGWTQLGRPETLKLAEKPRNT